MDQIIQINFCLRHRPNEDNKSWMMQEYLDWTNCSVQQGSTISKR